MTARSMRLARGWAGAAAATFAAALSHVLAGGNAPGLPVLLLSLALSGLICSLLAGRVLSLWRMSAAVILSQGLFHGLFSAGASGHYTVANPSAGHAGHLGHDMASMTVVAVGDATTDMAQAMHADSTLMLLFHAFAAVATITFLRRGEVAGVRLLRAIRLRLARFLPTFATQPFHLQLPHIPADWPVRILPNLGVPLLAMRHRGPPLMV